MPKVFITGVSTGLGNSLAREYLSMGYEVYGISRRAPENLKNVKNFHFDSADIREPIMLQSTLESLFQDVGELDLVILNAGISGKIQNISETKMSDLQDAMKTNLWANKELLDALDRLRIELKQVVAISSSSACSGIKGWSSYSISKAALNMLIKLYSAERLETHYSSIAPDLIDTPLLSAIFQTPNSEKFPTIEKLKKMKILSSTEAAKRVIRAIEKVRELPSGVFVDIREN